ncbi:MAG: VOC family protein [Deltaproteobacteria bacterium]|nr:VOC family protein [Deltaproteobacteria bacterium]
MKPRISIITLGVKDLEESTQFYEHGLGLPRMPFEGDAVFFELNGTWLALYPWSALAEDATVSDIGEGFRGITLAHNVESKPAVDEVIEQANKAGATILKPAQDVFWGGYSGYFSDPNGHLWEVAWNPHFWPGPK